MSTALMERIAPASSAVPECIHRRTVAGPGVHVSQIARADLYLQLCIFRTPLPPGWLYLILHSTFLPRAVGGLLAFGGLGWLTFSLTNLLSRQLGRSLSLYIMIPGMLGEASLILCLLAMGVNLQRWNEQAGAVAP